MLITQQQVEKLIGHNLLSQWEKGFIESVNDQMKRGRTLSSNQERIVNRCIEKTTPEKVAEGEEWAKEYRANHREIALICAKYYKAEGYFTFLSTSILEDEDFVPSKQQFTKMCENKYAKRVIENSKSPFQFGLGDLAKVRKVVGRNHGGEPGFPNQPHQRRENRIRRTGIKVSRRLIRQQQARVICQSPAKRDALLLAP